MCVVVSWKPRLEILYFVDKMTSRVFVKLFFEIAVIEIQGPGEDVEDSTGPRPTKTRVLTETSPSI